MLFPQRVFIHLAEWRDFSQHGDNVEPRIDIFFWMVGWTRCFYPNKLFGFHLAYGGIFQRYILQILSSSTLLSFDCPSTGCSINIIFVNTLFNYIFESSFLF
jgi:hypothetical protein